MKIRGFKRTTRLPRPASEVFPFFADAVNLELNSGEFFLVPARLQDRQLKPLAPQTTLLRITIP